MTAFALLPDAERTVRITEAAARLTVPPVIVEKDCYENAAASQRNLLKRRRSRFHPRGRAEDHGR
jgi:hypothetical protein